MILGNFGPLGPLTAKGRDDAETFWEFAAFVANSLVFLLMGAQLAQTDHCRVGTAALGAAAFGLLGRAVAVYGLCALVPHGPHRVSLPHRHVLFWGGLRGALALALGLPTSLPGRDAVVSVTFAVVAFSVVVQGLTIKPLLHRLQEDSPGAAPEPPT